MIIDTVAKPFNVVEKQLDEAQIKYTVTITRPTRQVSGPEEDLFYVVRQKFNDGIYHLTVAAKMGREKC
jgi:hypothetical protein